MQLHAGCLSRNSVRRILPALVLALAAFLFSAKPALADGKTGDQTLVRHWRTIMGPVEVHLVFTDADGRQQDYSLADAPPDFLKNLPLPLQAANKFPLLQPKFRYFDGLWLANGPAVCKEVLTDVEQAFRGWQSKDQPYNTSCRPFKVGLMSAFVDPQAPAYFPQYNSAGALVIPVGGYPTNKVRQLQIELSTPPLNLIPFTLTTPCTCHDKNLLCDKDPDFTLFFEVTLVVSINSTELDSWKFGTRPQMNIGYYVGQHALAMKAGYEKQVAALESKLEEQLAIDVASIAATQEFSIVTIIAQFVEDLFKYGVGGLYALSCDANLYNSVSAGLSGEFNSPTVVKMANDAGAAFKTLFLALDSANQVGFTQLDIEEGPDRSLLFKLAYPAPAKPELQNAVAAQNKGIHLQSPSIGTGGAQIKPGVPFLVRGDYFLQTYTNGLEISWNKTVAGPPIKTELQWGPKGGKMQNVDDPALALGRFTPDKLEPGTAYQFRVHECDPISCAPWSDWLTTSTQGSGSNDVTIWLDGKSAQPVGTGVIQPNGSFLVKVNVPAGTTPGTHTLYAASGPPSSKGDHPEASVSITVAGAGGPGPSISVINSQTRTAVQPPINLSYPSTVTLRGNHFVAGVNVTLHLDSPTGPKLGTAIPNKLGVFVGNFQIPYASGGGHQLVAVQDAGKNTLQAEEEVILIAQPK